MTTQFNHYVTEMNSPLGTLTIVATDKGVCHIHFGNLTKCMAALKVWLKKQGRNGEVIHCQETLQPICQQLEEYFSGKRTKFDVPLDLCGTEFQKKVWNTLSEIEYGETKSYKEIAQKIGAPKAVRAIGGANNQNPIPIIIPCHRVIGSNGSMVGYGGGLDKKEILLSLEGVPAKIS
ncbi:methylated-DNA--[protein]-cysteine S-methyltransferase [Halalkalibacter akibai]|uniref:Methylated-DNA--protein-cysteine methyltransferase n=1 Tax=Halalkalibacter akibai (strain ATCC 43226 / DSM 21942 / CIP 109018 / JCM 9157 / 1139) TaxID=1236973 RepID=W4QY47_HALA3|nr:methylated-DNA--[protein]-cysteine S-methyltransferase [Halalkalibacter akibai]GAE36244.1 methylated-DNA-protein-cysteine methyltransferase [Halalkalibacter akibai JCM 9157]